MIISLRGKRCALKISPFHAVHHIQSIHSPIMSSSGSSLLLPRCCGCLCRRLCLSSNSALSPGSIDDPFEERELKKKKGAKFISLLKSEKDPNRILSICKSFLCGGENGNGSPTSYSSSSLSHYDRSALSVAVSSLSSSQSFSPIRSLLTSPALTLPVHHVIVLFGEANMLDDALTTFHNNRSKNVHTFNALLFACIVSNNHRLVPDFFRDLPTRYCINPDLTTYNTLLKALCQSGSSLSSYSVFDEMSRKRIMPNRTSFSIALAGFYSDHNLDLVDMLLLLMKKHACHPGLSVYNVRIQSLCKLTMVNEAKELLKEMKMKGMKPNWVTYHHLILGFCGQGDLGEAKRLYGQMARRGLVPESNCYFTLIHYLCRGGEFESALQVCKESMDRNWVPCFSTMRALVDGLVSISKTDEAREMVTKVKDKFPHSVQMWKEVEQALALQ